MKGVGVADLLGPEAEKIMTTAPAPPGVGTG